MKFKELKTMREFVDVTAYFLGYDEIIIPSLSLYTYADKLTDTTIRKMEENKIPFYISNGEKCIKVRNKNRIWHLGGYAKISKVEKLRLGQIAKKIVRAYHYDRDIILSNMHEKRAINTINLKLVKENILKDLNYHTNVSWGNKEKRIVVVSLMDYNYYNTYTLNELKVIRDYLADYRKILKSKKIRVRFILSVNNLEV